MSIDAVIDAVMDAMIDAVMDARTAWPEALFGRAWRRVPVRGTGVA